MSCNCNTWFSDFLGASYVLGLWYWTLGFGTVRYRTVLLEKRSLLYEGLYCLRREHFLCRAILFVLLFSSYLPVRWLFRFIAKNDMTDWIWALQCCYVTVPVPKLPCLYIPECLGYVSVGIRGMKTPIWPRDQSSVQIPLYPPQLGARQQRALLMVPNNYDGGWAGWVGGGGAKW